MSDTDIMSREEFTEAGSKMLSLHNSFPHRQWERIAANDTALRARITELEAQVKEAHESHDEEARTLSAEVQRLSGELKSARNEIEKIDSDYQSYAATIRANIPAEFAKQPQLDLCMQRLKEGVLEARKERDEAWKQVQEERSGFSRIYNRTKDNLQVVLKNAGHAVEALESAGMGGVGKANCLIDLAKEAATELNSMRLQLQEAEEKLNTPEIVDFVCGAVREAQHQRSRWGSDHDTGKQPEDWFWLLGYLAGKCLAAQKSGDRDKALHHTISTAAALANWHAFMLGQTNMRPGIIPPNIDAAVDTDKEGKCK